jgi:hypothetical protein
MEEVKQTTKIVLCWELFEQSMPKSHIAKQLGMHRETIHIWISGIQKNETGLVGFWIAMRRQRKVNDQNVR